MKNFTLLLLIGFLGLIGCTFYAFTDSNNNSDDLAFTKKIISTQNDCIDDLESSLYDFSNEISSLKMENAYLIEENRNLKVELKKYAQKAADLRSELTTLEEENYNANKKLEQVLIAREIRARHQAANTMNLNVASLSPSIETNATTLNTEEKVIAEINNTIEENLEVIEEKTQALEIAEAEADEAVKAINSNDARIQFNMEIDPDSSPEVNAQFSDPLVSNDVLYKAPEDKQLFYSQLEMVDNSEDIASAETDEFYSKSPVYSLIENTEVVYNYIACRNDRYGKKIKKLKSGSKNWKYTFLQFNLETENINLLLNKQFRMRVLSTDLNTYLNFTTDKSHKPATYYDFVYEGEAVKISFFNEKEIKGKSFDIQIFHIDNDEEYLLEDAVKTIFNEGQHTLDRMVMTK